MRLLAALLFAAVPVAVSAQSPDACDLAGTYMLDREPIHDGIIASMTESLADLGDRPDDGSFAAVEWNARRSAYRDVLAEARAGEIVPHMAIKLNPDGSFEHRGLGGDKNDSRDHGRWTADSACRTLTVDMDNDDQEEPSVVRIDGDRLVFEETTGTRRGALNGVSFDRVRR